MAAAADFTGKVIVVTGSAFVRSLTAATIDTVWPLLTSACCWLSQGIGRAIALQAAAAGATVVIADLPAEHAGGERTAADAKAAGAPDALFVGCDVSKGKQVKSLMDTAASTFGSIDVIYANAGIGSGSMGGTWAHEIDDDDFMMVLAVNLGGIFYCAKYGLPYLVESKVSAVLLVAGMSMCWQQCSQRSANLSTVCYVLAGSHQLHLKWCKHNPCDDCCMLCACAGRAGEYRVLVRHGRRPLRDVLLRLEGWRHQPHPSASDGLRYVTLHTPNGMHRPLCGRIFDIRSSVSLSAQMYTQDRCSVALSALVHVERP